MERGIVAKPDGELISDVGEQRLWGERFRKTLEKGRTEGCEGFDSRGGFD